MTKGMWLSLVYVLGLLTSLLLIEACSDKPRIIAVVSELTYGCDGGQKVGVYSLRAVNQSSQIAYDTHGIVICGLNPLTRVCSIDGLTFKVCEE